jgi:uncharacterized protein YaeQ
MNHNYHQDNSLTLAQHPSENDELIIVRLLAFVINPSTNLSFTKGLSTDTDQAELRDCDLTGNINLSVEFGQSGVREMFHSKKT